MLRFFWLLLLLALSFQAIRAEPLGAESKLRVLAFGDSLTSGVGGSGLSYPIFLERMLGSSVTSSGVPGELTRDGVKRLPAELRQESYSLVVLCLGTNDFLQKTPAEVVLANLQAMINTAADFGVPVVLVAIPGTGVNARNAHPIFESFSDSKRLVVDRHSLVEVSRNPLLKADLVHLNREGYRELAERMSGVSIHVTS